MSVAQHLFKRSLQDLIKGLRAQPENEAQFISDCMEECRRELKTQDVELKTNAVAKLNYMQMLGYDVSWAAFNVSLMLELGF